MLNKASLRFTYDRELRCSVNFLKATYNQIADVKQIRMMSMTVKVTINAEVSSYADIF